MLGGLQAMAISNMPFKVFDPLLLIPFLLLLLLLLISVVFLSLSAAVSVPKGVSNCPQFQVVLKFCERVPLPPFEFAVLLRKF